MVVVTSVKAARAPAALRVVAPAAPLRLPRRRARAAAPAVDRRSSSRPRPAAPSSGGPPGRPPAGSVAGLAASALPASGAGAARPAGHLGGPRGAAASSRSTSPVATWTGCRSRPASSSPGASSPARAGPARTPTPCPPPPTAAACGSPSRTSATAARPGRGSGPAPARSSRAPTAGSAPRARTRRKVALIGAGVGITPLRALAEGLAYGPGDAVLVQRYADQPLFARELDVLAARARPRCLAPGRRAGTPGGAGDRTPTTSGCTHWVPDLAERDVFVCGPDGWTELVRRDRRGRRAAPASTSTSRPSRGDPMKRIVLWLLQHRSRVVLLFGYHTSTSGLGRHGAAADRRQPRRPRRRRPRGTGPDRRRVDRPRAPHRLLGTVTGDVVADPVGPGAGPDHDRGRRGSPRSRSCSTPRATARTWRSTAYALPILVDETLDGAERRHRHGQRRHGDQRRLRRVPPVGPGPGRAVTIAHAAGDGADTWST